MTKLKIKVVGLPGLVCNMFAQNDFIVQLLTGDKKLIENLTSFLTREYPKRKTSYSGVLV